MKDKVPVNITYGTARQWKRTADQVARPAKPVQRRDGFFSIPSIVRAQVTTAIPTGTWASPSTTGRAQIYLYNGTSWSAWNDPVVVYNDHTLCPGTSSVALNKVVKLAWIAGQWWLLSADN